MFPNGTHQGGGQGAGPGQLNIGPNIGHHLGHTISPMGPPSSGNQLPGTKQRSIILLDIPLFVYWVSPICNQFQQNVDSVLTPCI